MMLIFQLRKQTKHEDKAILPTWTHVFLKRRTGTLKSADALGFL